MSAPEFNTRRSPFSFWNMVAGVMTVLHLKNRYDEYHSVANEDEEGRVALTSATVPSEGTGPTGRIALQSSDLDGNPERYSRKRPSCVCCGMDCTLFWKAIGIVFGLFTLYYAFRLAKWALTPSPTGLEGMPEFSTSLGCADAPYIYNGSQVSFSALIGTKMHDHHLDIRGGAVGVVTVYDAPADATEVKYELLLRASDESMLQDVYIDLPEADNHGIVRKSRAMITTPGAGLLPGHCARFELNVYIPPNVQGAQLESHVITHFKFAPEAKLKIDRLYVTLFPQSGDSILVPSRGLLSKTQSFTVYSGWLVGEASIADFTEIVTQNGAGVANVKAYPHDHDHDGVIPPAIFRTTTGAGRSDFWYINDKKVNRPIDATHFSSKNADVYLTYSQSGFNGKVAMDAGSYSMTGTRRLGDTTVGSDDQEWTHYVGQPTGKDKMVANSRGWMGLYF